MKNTSIYAEILPFSSGTHPSKIHAIHGNMPVIYLLVAGFNSWSLSQRAFHPT
jgi:hypothetical protein